MTYIVKNNNLYYTLNGDKMDYLTRLESLIGKKNIQKLQDQVVLVVGLGGVGGYTVEALARCGIGTLIIIDYDTIEESNLNRQIIAGKSNIGLYKCDEWEKRITNISNTKVIKLPIFLEDTSVLDKYKIDYIVDACDSIKTKQNLIKYGIKNKIPCISSMGTAKKINPTKLTITELDNTSYDPIAKRLRKWKKEEKIKNKIMVVSSIEEVKTKDLGSILFVPAYAGILMAYYIVKEIIK